ncbi:MAG: aldehyde dehydrogenase family protein [Chloroflexi bacterium]|nr:aldehyde dehydrogenase family protein [Chloroflexota bacterium]
MTTTAARTPTYQMYVEGKWTSASDGRTYAVINPATEEPVGLAPNAGRQDMRQAIQAARKAFDEGAWPHTDKRERARIIRQIADGLTKRKDELKRLVTAEAGAEAYTYMVNVDWVIEHMYDYADLAATFEFDEMVPPIVMRHGPGSGRLINSMVYYAPVGVCGLIPTWNYPLFTTIQKVGPALAAGATMVVKTPPYAPLVNLLLAKCVAESDLPHGVFNVVTGESVEISTELVDSPMVDKVSFTGSVATGKKIMEAGSKTLKRVHLELGGKSPLIILDDANLDMAVPAASAPAFMHSGQGCVNTTRVLVSRKNHDMLVQKMANQLKNVKMGDPADPQVMMGPVIREERRTKIEEYIASGKAQGAELVTGGKRPAHLPKGFFVEPTVFANVRNDMKIAREEIFGPVVSVIPYTDEADAIRIANDTTYGLGATIFTTDMPKGRQMARRMRAGSVSVGPGANVRTAPFGGFKESGIGRESGKFGVAEYTEMMAIHWS